VKSEDRMRLVIAVAMVAVMFLGVGCNSGPRMKTLPLAVTPDETLKGSSIRVHLVGVTDAQLDAYAKYPVDQWFSPDDMMRREAVGRTAEMRFDAQKSGPQTVDRKNPIWEKWKADGVMHVVVFANLPSSGAPGREPGKYVLPLDSRRWESAKDVVIQVKPGGIMATPAPGPMK
jgi:hypothetical protein